MSLCRPAVSGAWQSIHQNFAEAYIVSKSKEDVTASLKGENGKADNVGTTVTFATQQLPNGNFECVVPRSASHSTHAS